MVTYAYTDTTGRKITQTAYNAQKNAGTDVSGYKAIGSTTPANPVLPTQTITPPVAPTPTAPVAPTTTVLPISKESEVYKQLTAKGYDDAKIIDLYNQAKAKKTPEEQARITKQEPVKPSTAIDPMAEPATPAPAVNVNVNNTPAEQVEQPKTDQGPLTPLALSEYQDNSTVRQNEIVNNLNGYRQSNPEYLTNLDTFRKTFSYGLRSDDQKQLLDNWYLGYQKGVELGNMRTGAIVDQYGSGNITSSDLEQLRLNNPSKYQEAMDAINKKDIVRTYQNELYETDEQKTIMAQLDEADGQGSIFEEYKNTINSDEVKALQTEIQDMETQREQLSLELNDIKDQVEKRYEGTGATKGKIAYIVAKESAALQKQITSLGIDSANRVDKYNSIVNTAKETMQLQLQEQEAERAARNQKMSELGFYYEYDPVGMAERAENIFNIENPDINSPDANTARRALNNELTKYYEQYGDIIIRPQSQALNDILLQAKTDGTSLSAALKKNFTDQLQSKQLYGQALGKNLGFDMGSYSMSQGADGNWRVNAKNTSEIRNINGVDYSYNPATDSYSTPNVPMSRADVRSSLSSIVSSTGSSDMSTIATAIQNNYQDGVYGGQCGEFVNDIASSIGSSVHFGDTLENKVSKINSQTASVGSYVVMDTGVKGGHVGMVTAINNDGTITIKDSNRGSDEKVQTHTLSQSQMSKVKGYVTPVVDTSKFSSGNAPTAAELAYFAKGATGIDPKGKDGITQARYNEIANYQAANKSTTVQPLTDDQRVVYNNQLSSFRSNPVVKTFEDGMTQYSNIESSLEDVSGPGDVAAIFQFMKALDPTSVVRESEFQVAAASAGVVNQIGNTYNKIMKGQRLTDVQREAFGKLAKQFILNRGKSYDRLYDDFVRVIDNMGIDKTYLPTRATTQLYSTTPTTQTITNPFTQGFTIPAIGGVVASFYGG